MAKLARKTAILFAGTATVSNNIAQYGSLANSTANFTGDPNVIQALSQWGAGWAAAVIGNDQPELEDRNALDYVLSYFICNISERGILDIDLNGGGTATLTQYNLGSIAQDGSGNIYVSQVNSNNAPLSNTNNWTPLGTFLSGAGIAKGWVEFDGTTNVGGYCTIINSFNVATVQKIRTGQYIINFTNALPTNYSFAGSAGTQNGQSPVGGDNNIIVGGVPGYGNGIRSTTQCQVFCWEANLNGNGALEDSGCISVNFFGQ